MSLVIRFTKVGRKGERKYRLVVKEQRSKRDGTSLEILGFYEKTLRGETKEFDQARMDYWISKGAQLSEGVKKKLHTAE